MKTVREGIRPDGRLLRYPMARLPEFTESDAKAIYAYLKTVPAIPVRRSPATSRTCPAAPPCPTARPST